MFSSNNIYYLIAIFCAISGMFVDLPNNDTLEQYMQYERTNDGR